MEADELYELVVDAVRTALDEQGGAAVPLSKRMIGGQVLFRDAEGRTVKEVDAAALFKKITAVREKLRVMEQKLNNHPSLAPDEVAELQGYLTRAYGSLTTFNFLFRDEKDRFVGTGG
jgi:hypothetical protein